MLLLIIIILILNKTCISNNCQSSNMFFVIQYCDIELHVYSNKDTREVYVSLKVVYGLSILLAFSNIAAIFKNCLTHQFAFVHINLLSLVTN